MARGCPRGSFAEVAFDGDTKGQILKARRGNWLKRNRYYILDLSGNVIDADIDPEELARKLGVLKEGKEVEHDRNIRPK